MSGDRPAAGGTTGPEDPLRAGGMGRTRRGGGSAPPLPTVGLLGALAGALVRRAGQVLGNTAPGAAPAAATACSICGLGARAGKHVAPVFRLRTAAGQDAPHFLLVPVDPAGRQARPLCLACATGLISALELDRSRLEVEA